MADVHLEALSRTFDGGVVAVDGIDLSVADGEFCALVGPSGSGKTTVLRLIAGLDRPTGGSITIGGRRVDGIPAHRRGVSLVRQEPALYPHLTAGDNLAFPLRVRRASPDDIDRRVDDVAEALGVRGQLVKKPAEMAAGHRQGVATGRALLGGGDVLLMDEPMANLDAPSRAKLHADLLRLKAEGTTIIYVTNDQAEAMSLADRIAVLSEGRLQQAAPPHIVYSSPANMMVAEFVGSPPMNMALASVFDSGSGLGLAVGSRRLILGAGLSAELPRLAVFIGAMVVVGIRPEDLRFGGRGTVDGAVGEQRLGGEIVHTEFVGRSRFVYFSVDATARDGSPGAEFVALLPGSVEAAVGDHIGLAVDMSKLQLFDPADEASLRAPPATAPGTSS